MDAGTESDLQLAPGRWRSLRNGGGLRWNESDAMRMAEKLKESMPEKAHKVIADGRFLPWQNSWLP
eukprot:1609329-Alexandrium_andersonii.AAC.1